MAELYKTHLKSGSFEILAFPCNQFGSQEPGTSAQVHDFVRRRFDAQFKIMEKINVNGIDTHPVYRFLKKASQLQNPTITWNFAVYFLVSKSGEVVAFPNIHPTALQGAIADALAGSEL